MSEHYIYQTNVKKEWVDYNGHMNDAEYNRVFSDATDAWLALIGLNQETIQRLQYTIFTLENHITFLKEMKEDENIQAKVHLYDYDSKRVHVYMEMFNKDDICSAIYEVMLMGIDINTNRSSPFPEQILESIELYFNTTPINERPKQLGHRIGINRRK
ncbi:thioesterase family protein [Staphylococcus haemolyticus]|uniref:thioesterase family protein n=1 Tax=Staphylococcus haemolyticus TaxID=1283 RepID=UPI002ACEA454|nr:thioesterase family protein [Staphylococcus haemolyticus]